MIGAHAALSGGLKSAGFVAVVFLAEFVSCELYQAKPIPDANIFVYVASAFYGTIAMVVIIGCGSYCS